MLLNEIEPFTLFLPSNINFSGNVMSEARLDQSANVLLLFCFSFPNCIWKYYISQKNLLWGLQLCFGFFILWMVIMWQCGLIRGETRSWFHFKIVTYSYWDLIHLQEAFQRLPLPYANQEFNINSINKHDMGNESEPPPYVHLKRSILF